MDQVEDNPSNNKTSQLDLTARTVEELGAIVEKHQTLSKLDIHINQQNLDQRQITLIATYLEKMPPISSLHLKIMPILSDLSALPIIKAVGKVRALESVLIDFMWFEVPTSHFKAFKCSIIKLDKLSELTLYLGQLQAYQVGFKQLVAALEQSPNLTSLSLKAT